MINTKRYDELKDQMVWVRFCHADSSIGPAREREKSRIELEPILVRLSDALFMVPKPEEWEVYDPALGVDSRCYRHQFATPGYPGVEKLQKGIIRKLREMGHEMYSKNAMSYDDAYVKPLGEPEVEVTAPLIELWIGEYEHETKELGQYTGKTYSQKQIDETYDHVSKAREMLEKREVVSPKDGSFDDVAEAIGVSKGELVWRKFSSQRYTAGAWITEDKELVRVVRTKEGGFALVYPFDFPEFSADQKELIEVLESLGTVTLEHHGRSGFASRNWIIVKPKEPSTHYHVKVVNEMSPAYSHRRYMTERDERDILDYSLEDVERAEQIVEEAHEIISQRRVERFKKKFDERSLDGVFSLVTEGGYEDDVIIPRGRFVECFRARVANTQDHRQNLSHTDDVAYIDVEEARKRVRNGKLHVDIPEEYMGRMIGGKGSNIQRLQEVLGKEIGEVRIILHPKTREEITLAMVKKEVQKNQNNSNPGE